MQLTNLQDIEFVLAEPNETLRTGLLGMLRQQGLRHCRPASSLDALLEATHKRPMDFIAVADSLDEEVFHRMRDIRHHKLGMNPFTVITFMVDPDNDRAMKQAVLSGADDVMLKPVAPGKIVERAKHIAFHRTPFIATSDYIGPDRRRGERESQIPSLNVINTLRDKMDGKKVTARDLKKMVDKTMISVRSAQLDSHGLKLGYVCNLILKAYDEKLITKKVEENLLTLVSCLEEAGKTAKMIGELELAEICRNFARQVEELAEDYENPDERNLDLIRKLTKAFAMAKKSTAQQAEPEPEEA